MEIYYELRGIINHNGFMTKALKRNESTKWQLITGWLFLNFHSTSVVQFTALELILLIRIPCILQLRSFHDVLSRSKLMFSWKMSTLPNKLHSSANVAQQILCSVHLKLVESFTWELLKFELEFNGKVIWKYFKKLFELLSNSL